MQKGVLAVAALTFLAGAGRSEDAATREGDAAKAGAARKKAVEVAGRLKGRVLGCLVREGMTREQVRRILGGEFALFLYVSNGSAAAWSAYFDLGVDVFYSPDEDDVFRVTRLTFWRLRLFD